MKKLIRYHDYRIPPEEKAVRRLLSLTGPEDFHLLMSVQEADTLAQSEYKRVEKLQNIMQVTQTGERILAEKQAVSLKDLAATGSDLISAGVPEGPEIGRILHRALDEILDDPSKNTKEYILGLAKSEQ